MKPIAVYTVAATLPARISALRELAYNFWWCWNLDAQDLFERIDKVLWEEVHHNPVALLNQVGTVRLEALASQPDFVSFLENVYARFQNYMHSNSWFDSAAGNPNSGQIAYFSLEYGINESFPNYSGGLGVLAGDHLKSASDLGIPLIGVGLLYQMGYFRQHITQSGWQSESLFENEFYSMPLVLMRNDAGEPLVVEINLPLGIAYANIWRAMIGRTPLYLLDTNIPQNAAIPEYRDISDQLYGGNTETRIQQEILLGIGGIRALRMLGINPSAIHINEGHAAFATLERTRFLMQDMGMDFHTAMELTHAGMIFTTHTPVPAGNEVFSQSLIDKYFGGYWQRLGLNREEFLALGQASGQADLFSMTVLALRMSSHRNGVSKLHGAVARRMWQGIWSSFPEEEVPITSITNGVHTATWVAGGMAELYDRYLSPVWRTETHDHTLWQRIDNIPNEELWRVHQRYRERLVLFARGYQLNKQKGSLSAQQKSRINQFLNPDALTIGFARRFATYKRATLLFSDMSRLKKLLTNPLRPVQMIIAGKAHPHDNAGKELIQSIIHSVREYGLEDHVVFLEDYSMAVARTMVKGCDIWLNTPRRPLEASGTSGMKASLNGCLHVSVLDGWWDEAYNRENGFAIGAGLEYQDPAEQDIIEAAALYELLENEIIPLFYERNRLGVPQGWVARMKAAISTITPEFSTARMVREYTRKFYIPALRKFTELNSNGAWQARELKEWKRRVLYNWNSIQIQNVQVEDYQHVQVGGVIRVGADIILGNLNPHDIIVEAYYGKLGADGAIRNALHTRLSLIYTADGKARYEGSYHCSEGGLQGCTVRVLPSNEMINDPADLGLCTWA
jgi:starch phosphorylase